MNLFFVYCVFSSFVLSLERVQSLQHFGKLFYFHLVVSFHLNRFIFAWLFDLLLFLRFELLVWGGLILVSLGYLGHLSLNQADVLGQLLDFLGYIWLLGSLDWLLGSSLHRLFDGSLGSLVSVADSVRWVWSDRFLGNWFSWGFNLGGRLSFLLIILSLWLLFIRCFLTWFLFSFLTLCGFFLHFHMLFSNLEALAMSSFLVIIWVFIADLVSPLHILVLLVRNSFIFIIRLPALFMGSAVNLLLPDIFNTFLLLEVILIGELLDQPIPILVASVSPHLVRGAAVLEFVPPCLLFLVG